VDNIHIELIYIRNKFSKKYHLFTLALDIFVSICHGRESGGFVLGEGKAPRGAG
jgi:hypothetical protein